MRKGDGGGGDICKFLCHPLPPPPSLGLEGCGQTKPHPQTGGVWHYLPLTLPSLAGTLVAGTLVAGTLVAGTLVAGTLVAGTLVAGTLVAGTLVAGTLVASTLVAGALVAGTLVAGTLVILKLNLMFY